MVSKDDEHLSIRRQCGVLGIHRSKLYYCGKPAPDESILANEIHEIWTEMPYYGYRKITIELQNRGYEINHKKVLRMMRDMRIQALYPRPKLRSSSREHKKYPYLLRNMVISEPNHVWETDITYIRMPAGFVYLIAIIDVYSRYLVSWSLSNTLEADFCLSMLKDTLQTGNRPEILNTDQGVQFTSSAWIECVESNGIKVSMDGIGRWADNIFIERFWRTLKHEHILINSFDTIREVRRSIAQFIEIYNHKRLHQGLGYKTPAEIYLR